MKTFKPLTDRENYLGKVVVDIAFSLHKYLGSGLLESVYEKCFCYELEKQQIQYIRQQKVPIQYENLLIEDGLD